MLILLFEVMILGELCNFAGTHSSNSPIAFGLILPPFIAAYAFVEAIVVVRTTHSMPCQPHSSQFHPSDTTRRTISRHLRHPLFLLPQREAKLFRLARLYTMYSKSPSNVLSASPCS